MGQVESQSADVTAADDQSGHSSAAADNNNSQPPSMDSLIAEAAAFGEEDENASIDEKAQRALDCPCIADLRKGACGTPFSEAFLCFLKSTAEEKGSDCVHPFVALQSCIKANPGAFSKDVLEDDEVEKEKRPTQENKIKLPSWSVEQQKVNPKL
ncbi:hypothetical protein LguiA_031359 [Lonicera macranthoides]